MPSHLEIMKRIIGSIDNLEEELAEVVSRTGTDFSQVAVDRTIQGGSELISIVVGSKYSEMRYENEKETGDRSSMWVNRSSKGSLSDIRADPQIVLKDIKEEPDYTISFREGTREFEFVSQLIKIYII